MNILPVKHDVLVQEDRDHKAKPEEPTPHPLHPLPFGNH